MTQANAPNLAAGALPEPARIGGSSCELDLPIRPPNGGLDDLNVRSAAASEIGAENCGQRRVGLECGDSRSRDRACPVERCQPDIRAAVEDPRSLILTRKGVLPPKEDRSPLRHKGWPINQTEPAARERRRRRREPLKPVQATQLPGDAPALDPVH